MINFKKYDEENPQIWEAFIKFAKQAKARGFKNYSSKGIFEIIRWHTAVSGNEEYKLSNNYTPDYARKMMAKYPEFEGFFRLKKIKERK